MSYEALIGAIEKSCVTWQIEENEGKAEAVFWFDDDFDGFKGHFPGMPILPAVVQLVMVRVIAQLALGTVLKPVHYSNTKFKGIIQPREKLTVAVTYGVEEGKCSGGFSIEKDDKGEVTSGHFEFSKYSEVQK